MHEPAELTEEPAVTSEELLTNGILCQFVDHAPHDLPTTSDRESGPLPSKLPVVLDGSLVHDCMHGARPNVGTIGQTSRDTPCGHLDMQAGLSTLHRVAAPAMMSHVPTPKALMPGNPGHSLSNCPWTPMSKQSFG